MRRTLELGILATVLAVAGIVAFPADETSTSGAPRLSRLQGRVRVDRRNPVIGATVVLRPQDDPARVYMSSTGEKGAFRIDDLADGAYRLQVVRGGYDSVIKNDISMRFPFRAVIEITMTPIDGPPSGANGEAGGDPAPIAVRGRAVDTDDVPQTEVSVRLVRLDGSEDPALVRSDDDGVFRFPELSSGRWRVEVRGSGFLPMRAPLLLDADTELGVFLVPQPADYEPSPLEMLPDESPIAPPSLRG